MNKQEILTALKDGPQQQVWNYTEYGETRQCIVLGVDKMPINTWSRHASETWRVRIIPIYFYSDGSVGESSEKNVSLRQIQYELGITKQEWRIGKQEQRDRQQAKRNAAQIGAPKLEKLAKELGLRISVSVYSEKAVVDATEFENLIRILTDAKVVADIRNEIKEGK